MKRSIATLLAMLLAGSANAYPLDGFEYTKIERLKAFDLAREPLLIRGDLKPGSLWPMNDVYPRLRWGGSFDLPPPDREMSAKLREMLGAEASAYGVAVLDLSDPGNPRYAEVNGGRSQLPGSLGKICVGLAWFQALADLYPDDFGARHRLLRDTVITANGFIRKDSHKVPFVVPGKVERRPIEEGDTGSLWTWMDWMFSASSNAAASMLMSELVLLKKFGKDYPPSGAEAEAFWANTSKADIQRMMRAAVLEPLKRNGLNAGKLSQASLFTREGRKRIPTSGSTATARELVRYMLLLEQGRLVDGWSSTQLKRLLYLTDIRIRYAAQAALDGSAVYFKSGSLYSCKPEKGFECGKYIGNARNYMNSVAIVETRKDGVSLHYIVAVLSNVLRKNSLEEHKALALHIHEMIGKAHGVAVGGASAATTSTAGR